MTQITLPEKVSIKDQKDNRYQVVIEPFYPGFGVTVGNSLRRALLSSLGGAAVTSFKIDGAQHEFDSVEFIKEDLVEIMLNLKKLRLKVFSEEPIKLTLEAKGEKVVTAADITKNSEVEIINKDLVIATLTDKTAKLAMEIVVEQGIGYVTVEQRDEKEKLEIGNVAIDASFSPVLNVSHNIESVRVGKITNYDKLTMDILTDGTISAEGAIAQAAKILEEHFNFLTVKEETKKKTTKKAAAKEKEEEVEEKKEEKEDKE
jgi:DNA-directed RNA polymerase subunit alpha